MEAPTPTNASAAAASGFAGYHKIQDSTRNWVLPRGGKSFGKAWAATEKVHGANFCFIVSRRADGQVEVRCGKRREVLRDGEDFFGHAVLLDRLRPQVLRLFAHLEQHQTTLLADHVSGLHKASSKKTSEATTAPAAIERVLLFGELCGGRYPHPEVPPDARVEAVQTGVYYSPTIEFYAFDIALELAGGRLNEATDDSLFFLDYDKALEIFRSVELLCAEPLAVGTYEEMLEHPVEFESTIPARLGLPPLPTPNRAEGIVLKPMKTLYVATSKGSSTRAIVKKKTKQFSEENQYHQAEKWQAKPADGSGYGPSEAEMIEFEMYALITRNRLNNVISKMGRVEANEKEKVVELLRKFMEDVMEQLREDNADAIRALPTAAKTDLNAKLRAECKQIIVQHFKDLAAERKAV
ncbi:RNA editing ligase [Acanthamoeba castellanii str. Neff]|uniref:RNA editing ligase n=1 Tax=Acanthamoeba castellanii (strain ATCC 30010 / Neff) TaxID=1257118 RepID=L8HCM1_ACACF|nr:RNA editing ligase [Acanthamoeba castellanii str. Neff]ELR22498.1 RNA editing ligase [Acanthamoeba castellanii str. Neff]